MKGVSVGFAIASILLSVVFWAYVEKEADLRIDQQVKLPLVADGLPEGLTIKSTIKDKIDVIANGTIEDIQRLKDLASSGRFGAVLDLRRASPEDEEPMYEVRLPHSAARRIGIRFTQPPDEHVRIEYGEGPEQTVLVSVTLKPNSIPAPGFRLVQFEAVPLAVRLSGRLDDLKDIKNISTEPIDLTGMKATATRASVRLILPAGVKANPAIIEVRLVIEPTPKIEGTKPVPKSGQ